MDIDKLTSAQIERLAIFMESSPDLELIIECMVKSVDVNNNEIAWNKINKREPLKNHL